ncbi:hypothetical protein [Rufibacter tibetensis]|uniref:Uncharacterized protein n=1 Tax=Rufibacter tibetensis TaxID=512763 RepID=A0A0P0CNA3_9BACT|nr:hypothetical protein [Rufibacter tibetensis]ALI98598.1 hypothetical protein DC20_05955 [Rufibacter tibetensis]
MDKDISLAEDFYEFQKKEWFAFRVFWVLMAGVLTAAAFGLFGKGLLSDKTVTSNGVRFEYNKFMRVEKGTELLVGVGQGGKIADISINNDYIRKVKIDQVIPQPTSVEVRENKVIYRFSSVQNGFVTFYLIPYKMGSQPLEVTVGKAQLRANQFVYF